MAGSALVSAIVCTPVPGMAKVIVSSPLLPFAKMIASRNDTTPSFAFTTSSAVVTIVSLFSLLRSTTA